MTQQNSDKAPAPAGFDLEKWSKDAPEVVKGYSGHFTPEKFFDKLRTSALAAGLALVARALLIYYAVFPPSDNEEQP